MLVRDLSTSLGGGSPTDMLLNDRPLLLCVGLWAAAVAFIIYGPTVF